MIRLDGPAFKDDAGRTLMLRGVNLGGSSISHRKQGDNATETALRLMLGWGNLVELERHPIPFPYQLRVTYEQTMLGAGVPLRKEFRLGLEFFF